jgi:hypothetical protein
MTLTAVTFFVLAIGALIIAALLYYYATRARDDALDYWEAAEKFCTSAKKEREATLRYQEAAENWCTAAKKEREFAEAAYKSIKEHR